MTSPRFRESEIAASAAYAKGMNIRPLHAALIMLADTIAGCSQGPLEEKAALARFFWGAEGERLGAEGEHLAAWLPDGRQPS